MAEKGAELQLADDKETAHTKDNDFDEFLFIYIYKEKLKITCTFDCHMLRKCINH